MKQGWEIKKLGEVCTIQTGKLDANAKVEEGAYPFYTCDSQPYRIDTYAFDDEAILISGNGSQVGHVNYYKGKFNAYQRTYVLTKFSSFDIPFLIKYLKGYLRGYIWDNKKGGCIPYITLPILKNFQIPCPPLPEQEKIVSELDCLSGIIEKKRQQLKELDALAQSIFYEMFGDPVGHEKGWEVKKLGEVGELARGVSKHRPRNAPELLGGNIPLIQTGDVANSGMYITCYNSTYSELGLSQSRLWPKGTLCITIAATIGKCSILTFDSCFPDSVVGYIVDTKWVNNEYIYYIFNRMQAILEENAPAVAQKNINLQVLNSLLLPIPPLPLQQSFAQKIEAIEQQKALIKQSIAEVETLFNARMQEYFE